MRVTAYEESFDLLPDRGVYWPRRRTLLVADLHLGKPNVFRVAGIPVPDSCPSDLARLSTLIRVHAPERLVILGDLLHAKAAHSTQLLDALAAWRAAHRALDILLIRGNHDTHAGDPPASLGFRIENEPFADVGDASIKFRHFPPPSLKIGRNRADPSARAGAAGSPSSGTTRLSLALCGHLHPAVRLNGPVSSLRADCFYLAPGALVLPAFGAFTGSKVIVPSARDRVFVVGEREVIDATRAIASIVVTTRPARRRSVSASPRRES